MTFKGKYGPLLIAEIGGNHEGDYSYANDLLDLAIKSKADVIKYQIYYPETLVNKNENPDRFEHFKRFTLKPEQHIELAKKCNNAGKVYLASVWDIDALNWINKYSSMYKIGSGDLTAYPVIEKIVELGKPIILSTGLSTFDEISQTVNFIQKINSDYNSKEMLAVLQCTSMYPILESEVNLGVMQELKERLNVSIGYSDHTENIESLYLAAVLGANVLEFHFTDTREGKKFRDHKVSLTSHDIDSLVLKLNRYKSIMGSPIKSPTKSEISNNHHISFRRAIYPIKKIKKGQLIKESDLIALRPNHGLDATLLNKIVGKKSDRELNALQPLKMEYFI